MSGNNKNNQKDQPTDEKKPSDYTQVKYRDISDEELKKILEGHKKWLESNEQEGERANLKDANLERVELGEDNLQKAELNRANLQDANLNRAKMQRACLDRANFKKATLYKTKLQNSNLEGVTGLAAANLRYANFKGATGLLGNEFAQADVTGTKLPDDIKEFKALEIIKETSQNARKIFFAMLLGCVYSWLTIATTTDVRLLTNTASSPLPIIGTEIPIAWFYIAAPIVLIALYLYLHFYLQGLWEGLAGLPAKFPDGKRLDERAYPWLLNRLVRRHFRLLKKDRSIMAKLQELVVIFLAWWVVPITMIAFWLRYIPRHDWEGTSFHIGLIVISVGFGIIFYLLSALTLQGKERVSLSLKNWWRDKNFYFFILKKTLFSVFIFMVGSLFALISIGAINGIRTQAKWKPKIIDFYIIEKLVPWAFGKIGYNVFADFREKDISERPDNYWEIIEKNQLNSVKGANLKGRNLEKADMTKAFLVRADFRNALLNGAYLLNANLQQADLQKANLQQADLGKANLEEANLMESNLQQANLRGANLQRAKLWFAKLEEANLMESNLQQANLRGANLQRANLEFANLQQAELVGDNLYKVNLFNAKLQKANLKRANLQQANLGKANLQEANLMESNLQQANLERANLEQAVLVEAILKEANLARANLQQAYPWKANLQRAFLMEANLQQADLGRANLQQANLYGANLKQADLGGANLHDASVNNADLTGTKNLTIEQLSKVKTLYGAKLDPELMEQVKKCCPYILEKPKEETDQKDKTE